MPAPLLRLTIVLLVLLAPGAAAAQLANGGFFDPIGDVGTTPAGAFVVPDIAGGSFTFQENLPGITDDDVVGGAMYDQAASGHAPAAGANLAAGQLVHWWIDSDGNAATGSADGPAGWDWLFEVEGVAAPAFPTTMDVFRWDPSTKDWLAAGTLPVSVTRSLGGGMEFFTWTVPAPDIGLVRGTTMLAAVATSDPLLDQDVATNRDDTSIVPLTIPAPPVPLLSAVTAAADTPGGATVRAGIDTRGTATTWLVRYGLDAPTSATAELAAGAAIGTTQVSAVLTGLRPGSTYVYQVVARNRFGETAGPLGTFRTLDALAASVTATTGNALEVTRTSAALTGTVDPQGRAVSWWFEWRPAGAALRRTARVDIPAGQFGAREVDAALTGLAPGTAHRATLVVETGGERRDGAEVTFTTTPGILLAVTARGRCSAAGCSVRTLRSRVTGPLRGLRITVRCVRRCTLPGTPRVAGAARTTDLRAAVGARLPLGAVVRVTARVRGLPSATAEIRATRAGLRVTAG